jgi:UV DNA damage endonuclease
MATRLVDASPSKTITVKSYEKLPEEARFSRLRRIAAENLTNTLRILRYSAAHHVRLYRFTSKLIPLATHPLIAEWDYLGELRDQLAEIGAFARENEIRVSAHPDHFTVLNSPDERIFQDSLADLEYQTALFEAMGLDDGSKMVVHVGGAYKGRGGRGQADEGQDQAQAQGQDQAWSEPAKRFVANFRRLPERVAGRIILENDDRSYTASEALMIGKELGVPVCLDLHHFRVNHGVEESLDDLLSRAFITWRDLAPKVHVSSPKSESEPRSHADFVETGDLGPFFAALRGLREPPGEVDMMVEAKMKDEAMFRLVDQLASRPGVKRLDEANLLFE